MRVLEIHLKNMTLEITEIGAVGMDLFEINFSLDDETKKRLMEKIKHYQTDVEKKWKAMSNLSEQRVREETLDSRAMLAALRFFCSQAKMEGVEPVDFTRDVFMDISPEKIREAAHQVEAFVRSKGEKSFYELKLEEAGGEKE